MKRQDKMPASNYHLYKEVKKIGSGNFGEVHLVESQTDRKLYIIKKLKITGKQQNKQAIFKEIQVMKSLNHQYIVKYFQSFKEGNVISIVMEYAEKGDLESYLDRRQKGGQPLSQEEVLEFLIQLCLGLKYVHERMILHRDLKAQNIFISAVHELKIGDFGISKRMEGTFDLSQTLIGTLNVMAPEVCDKKPYNQKSDIWSLGCVLYKMMTFRYPFQAQNPGSYVLKLAQGTYAPIKGDYSSQLKSLVQQLLEKEPHFRPSVQTILQKPFILRNLNHVINLSFKRHELSQQLIPNEQNKQNLKKTPTQKSLRKYLTRKGSLSSLSGSFVNSRTPKNQSLSMVEFKQGYPILIEENKLLKAELDGMKREKERFQEECNRAIGQILSSSQVGKEEAIQGIRSQILLYLYP